MKNTFARIALALMLMAVQLCNSRKRKFNSSCPTLVIYSFVFFLIPSGAAFADWQKVYPVVMAVWKTSGNQKHFNGQYDLYTDESAGKSMEGNPVLWHMRDYRITQTANDTDLLSKSSKYEYDCDKRLGRNLSMRGYEGSMASGKVVYSYDIISEWEDVKPRSMLEITWEIACGKNSSDSINSWLFNANEGNASISIATLTGKDGATFLVKPDHIKNLRAVLNSIRMRSGIDAPFFLMANDMENSFAGRVYGQRMIGMTLPMLSAIGSDQSALATTLGHELAHISLNHKGEEEKKNATNPENTNLWDKLMSVVTAPVQVLMDVRALYIDASYSRDQERDADKLGMEWAVAAGFSPCGVAAAMTAMGSTDNQLSVTFLSSHPSDKERIDNANQASIRINGKTC